MNKRIGIYSSVVNVLAVIAFSLCMLIGTNYWSYIVCMFIAFSFVSMMSAYCHYSSVEKRVAGYIAVAFSSIYTMFILAVYFAQVTAVVNDRLSEQAAQIIDYSKFGLFFSYDLLGYGLMALSTFFAGLTIDVKSKGDRWLKMLLLIHGVFFISCFIIPMLGLFGPGQSSEWIGVAVLQFWCIYFIPIGILSISHFQKKS
jgi:hypothetical protein